MQIQATTARGYEYYSIDGNEWNKPNLDTWLVKYLLQCLNVYIWLI